MSEFKVGDKVWVLCDVVNRNQHSAWLEVGSRQGRVWVNASDCRPVEPPVIKDCLTTESNSPKILDGSSEPMREAFERFLLRLKPIERSDLARNKTGYFHCEIEMAWQAYQAGAKYGDPSGGWEPTKDEIKYAMDRCGVPSSDPINPSHYRQFVIVTDNDGNQTLYVDGVLRDGDNTVYGCDVADAANECAIKIELRDVDFIVEHWPLRLNDFGVEAKQPETNPLAPSPCMDGVNVDDFVDGTMEARGRTDGFQVGLAEAFFTLLGVCLLGIVAYFFSDSIGPIPDEPIEQHVESVESMTPYGERSGRWQAVRNEFVELHPRCEACGLSWDLNVHHIKPFKDHPELELDMDNLITLCREHHFRIGHDPDGPWGWRRPSWTLYNPNVREDIKRWHKK